MSAQDSLQPKQLAMFMTPHEVGELGSADYGDHKIKEVYGEVRKNADADRYWGTNSGINHVTELTKKVDAAGGIVTPVVIRHLSRGPVLENGHHRATVAHETNRLVPALHLNAGWRQ